MRIAIIGIRGVPANFGGSETAVEEIGARLVQRGHQVTVYCRKHRDAIPGVATYRGMRRVVLPSFNTMSLDLMSHNLLCLIHTLGERYDVIHFHGVGNALWLNGFNIASRGAKSLLVVDGPDWKRPKWGRLAKLIFRCSFPLAVRFADEIISDNSQVQKMFRERYGRETSLVVYGADLEIPKRNGTLEKYGLKPGDYVLQVGALVPDKGTHILLDAYKNIETDLPLVIVGDTPYNSHYKASLLRTNDPRVRFLGYVYGIEYRELLANCSFYIHPLLIDGTSPALLQAMAYGRCIIASDLPEIDATLGNAGERFKTGDSLDLGKKLISVASNPDQVKVYGDQARQRVVENFNWEQVTDAYEQISQLLVTGYTRCQAPVAPLQYGQRGK